MPIKDDARRREYFRDYMAKRRAGDVARKHAQSSEAVVQALKTRIQELEAELARERAKPKSRLPRTVEELMAQKSLAEQEEKNRRLAARAVAASRVPDDIEEPTLRERLGQVEMQLKARNTEIKNLKARVKHLDEARKAAPPRMTKRLHRQIRAFLHPDRASPEEARRRTEVFQEFSAIKFIFGEE
ncbi:hypothetical protein L6654_40425 [Bradyrhizobium sp. WYCCWR 13023]|uniref:Uncharacterized protein n=1 Tax=Bradyrhizobium zhengyangense TaxID=2911009 RepID=A0A9X1RKN4_9BRAD|nr:hypothetical protein [Bradyrhizobium zhengyangense]MCG2632858.1 hypothetical protein [Bradyrhizobium zhengyangense]